MLESVKAFFSTNYAQLNPAVTLKKAKKVIHQSEPFMSSRRCSKVTVRQQQI